MFNYIFNSAPTGCPAGEVALGFDKSNKVIYASDGIQWYPSSVLGNFGSSTQLFQEEGNISRQVAAAAPLGNAADTTDDVLFAFTIPASSFDVAGRGVCLSAQGKLATNGNSKRVKIFFGCTTATVGSAVVGGTAVADSGASTGSNVGWQLTANLFKYGAANSNTQYSQATSVVGATHGGLNLPVLTTATENAAIIVAVTGSSAASAASDVLGYWFEVNAMN